MSSMRAFWYYMKSWTTQFRSFRSTRVPSLWKKLHTCRTKIAKNIKHVKLCTFSKHEASWEFRDKRRCQFYELEIELKWLKNFHNFSRFHSFHHFLITEGQLEGPASNPCSQTRAVDPTGISELQKKHQVVLCFGNLIKFIRVPSLVFRANA